MKLLTAVLSIICIILCCDSVTSAASVFNSTSSIKLLNDLTLEKRFRGEWVLLGDSNGTLNRTISPVESSTGAISIIKLRQYPFATYVGVNESKTNCDLIQANFIIRDGLYITDMASEVSVHGVFVPGYRVLLLYSVYLKMDNSRVSLTLDLPAIGTALMKTVSPPSSANEFERLKPFFDDYVQGKFLTEKAAKKANKDPKKCPVLVALHIGIENSTGKNSDLTPEELEREMLETTKYGGPLSSVVLRGYMNGLNSCAFNTSVIAHYVISSVDNKPAILYATFIVIMGVVDVLVFRAQQSSTETSQALASKLSPTLMRWQSLVDLFISSAHFTIAVLFEGGLWFCFIFISLLFFTKFSLMDVRYMFQLMRAHNHPIFSESGREIQRRVSLSYIIFYAIVFVSAFLSLLIDGAWYVIMACLSAMWIPQIIANIRNDASAPLVLHYVFMSTLTNITFLWYFTYNEDNFLGVKTHPVYCTALLFFIGLQVFVLFFQGLFGSRFFIPKLFQPAKYNYHREVPEDVLQNTAECVICMLPIEEPSPYAEGNNARILEDGRNPANITPERYMLTPCNHLFHTECLLQWMNEKMECPTCRGHLPTP